MKRFVYTGNTEAGCYLGGIVILNDEWPPIGPLCGEVGRLIFEDKRLEWSNSELKQSQLNHLPVFWAEQQTTSRNHLFM